MPIFSFCTVVGALLLGLICLAENVLGPPQQLAIATSFHGLPKPFKAAAPSVAVLPVREAPAPDAGSSHSERAFAEAPDSTPPKIVVPAKVVAPPQFVTPSNKVAHSGNIRKTAKVARQRPPGRSYAHGPRNDPTNVFAQALTIAPHKKAVPRKSRKAGQAARSVRPQPRGNGYARMVRNDFAKVR